MAFVQRKIDFTFNYSQGLTNKQTPGKNVTLSGLRASVGLARAGGASMTSAQCQIFGLPASMMNQLTQIGIRDKEFRQNKIQISAGDAGGAMSLVHEGAIETAYADYGSAPDVVLNIVSRAGLIEAMKPVSASSYKGAADAANIMADLAKLMGATFENNGVSVMLQNQYLPGTAWQQVQECAAAARIDYMFEKGLLAIWPRNGARKAGGPIRVAVDTGMVGYPTLNSNGIGIRTLFNPDLDNGKVIEVFSDIPQAHGLWKINAVYQTLESETPNGQWFTDILCGTNI